MNTSSYLIQGFKASAIASGIKKDGGLDMALIFSEDSATAAGVFTENQVKAAPVILSLEHIQGGEARAIIANSGNANACTGEHGLATARREAALVARQLGIRADEVIVASTGVIGTPLPVEPIDRAIPELVKGLAPEGIPEAAKAIMTTDSFPKTSQFEGVAGGKPYKIVAMAKGAGMIMPNMATMLCFVLSDIRIDGARLSHALSLSVDNSFNRISVDGDTSTNDMVVAMANGRAGNGDLSSRDYEGFQSGLSGVLDDLATMIVKDGEGATKLVYLKVKGAATRGDALLAVRTVGNSPLVKTAFYGQDPNWGRMMAALGRSGIKMREQDVHIWVDDVKLVEKGLGTGPHQEKKASERMAQDAFSVTIDLQQGPYEDLLLTCDLSPQYVTLNSAYRT